jgi:glycosyltransferase involved in cell wall biosynthesis
MDAGKNRKSIGLVVHSCSFTGAPLLGLNLAKYYKHKGYDVYTICLEKGVLFEQYKKYSRIFYVRNDLTAKAIMRLLKIIGVKNVICNSVVSGEMAKIAHDQKMKVISLVHELPGNIIALNAKEKANALAAYSDKVVFPANFVKRKFTELLRGKDFDSIIKPQGLYLKLHQSYDEETRRIKKREMGFLPQDRIVIGVGVGNKTKGVDLFFKIASKTQKLDKSVKFIWIGGTDKKHQWLERQANNKDTRLLPPTNHIEDFYRMADLFLLPSREDTFPSVVLEAIAYGLPVLGFQDAGGFIEIDSRFIHLADYLDCDAMSELVVKELSDIDRLEDIKRNGRRYIINRYRFSSYAEYLLDLFADIEYKKKGTIV